MAKGFSREQKTIAESLSANLPNPVCSFKGPTFANELINKFPTAFTQGICFCSFSQVWTLPVNDDFKSMITFYQDNKKLAFATLIAGGVSGFEALIAGWHSYERECMFLLQDGSFWSSVEGKKKYGNYIEFHPGGAYVLMSYG
jgi:hypothetical protein